MLNNGGASIFSSGKVNGSDVSNADIETLLQSYIAKNSDITEQNDITQNSDATGVINENDLEDILSEKSVMKFILGALDLDEENGVEDVRINGQFDERVQQQGTGDCYLLATLKSLSELSQGQEIIRNTITTNSDGSFTVSFPGIERSYTFTAEDIDAADSATIGSTDGSIVGSGMGRYSEGDDDVLLIEMAYEKFRDEAYHGQIPSKPEWPAYVLQSTSEANYNAGKSTLTSGNMS